MKDTDNDQDLLIAETVSTAPAEDWSNQIAYTPVFSLPDYHGLEAYFMFSADEWLFPSKEEAEKGPWSALATLYGWKFYGIKELHFDNEAKVLLPRFNHGTLSMKSAVLAFLNGASPLEPPPQEPDPPATETPPSAT